MAEQDTASQLSRPTAREFLAEVLRDLPDLPAALPRRLAEVVDQPDDRPAAIRKLFEELGGE